MRALLKAYKRHRRTLVIYGARCEGMCTTSSHASVFAYHVFACTSIVAAVPAAGLTTLGAHTFVEMMTSATSKQLHERHAGHHY